MLTFLLNFLAAGMLMAAPLPAEPAKADSVRTEMRNGQKHIVHTVTPKENFYSLARRYNVPVQQIRAANPGVEAMQIGQIVYIPVASAAKAAVVAPVKSGAKPAAKNAGLPAASRTFSVDEKGKKWHTVAPGQTLYSLSNLFEIPVEELQRLNDLKGTDLRAGQVLLVGLQSGPAKPNVGQYVPEKDDELEAAKAAAIAKPQAPVPVVQVSAAAVELAQKPEPEEPAMAPVEPTKRLNETGLAAVINEQFKSNKLLALHRSAPIGTLLQVKNSMNGRTVFVRVIGQLPDTGENDKVIVKISNKAYQKLGALDARFLAEVSYAQ